MPDPSAPSSPTPSPRPIVSLSGVYDADGTPLGELAYFIGARLGRAHCSLCDITHGLVRAKPAWEACRAALPVPFRTFHRDDMPAAVRDAAGGSLPVVVAETDDGSHLVLLGPEDLDACAGSVEAMVERLGAAARARGLDLDVTGIA